MASRIKYNTDDHPFESPSVARLRHTTWIRDGLDPNDPKVIRQDKEAFAAKIAKRIGDIFIESGVDLDADQVDRLVGIIKRGGGRYVR